MGNEISQCPPEEGPHVELQQKYFEEYKKIVDDDPERAKKDAEFWESKKDTILDMPILEQAKYADYVTVKICEEDEEIVKSAGLSTLKNIDWYIESKKKFNTCAIANVAKIIISQEPELRKELEEKFEQLLEVQRALPKELSYAEEFKNISMNDAEDFNTQIGNLTKRMINDINEKAKNGDEIPKQDPAAMLKFVMKQISPDADIDYIDLVFVKLDATKFLQSKIDEGCSVKDAVIATKEKYPNLPPDTQLGMKITMPLNAFDDDKKDDNLMF